MAHQPRGYDLVLTITMATITMAYQPRGDVVDGNVRETSDQDAADLVRGRGRTRVRVTVRLGLGLGLGLGL
eukprot:scaffold39881_cov36-Phaeocystis_antarctica.AAC.2